MYNYNDVNDNKDKEGVTVYYYNVNDRYLIFLNDGYFFVNSMQVCGSVLVTGSSRGLGLELVRQLIKAITPPEVIIATCRNPNDAQVINAHTHTYTHHHHCLLLFIYFV